MNFKMYVEFLHVSVIIFNGKCLKKKRNIFTLPLQFRFYCFIKKMRM